MRLRIALAGVCALAALCAGCAHRSQDRAPSRGAVVFASQCAACHGVAGAGGPLGPSLRGERGRKTFSAVVSIVKDPAPPMPRLYPAEIDRRQLLDVSAYVESL